MIGIGITVIYIVKKHLNKLNIVIGISITVIYIVQEHINKLNLMISIAITVIAQRYLIK